MNPALPTEIPLHHLTIVRGADGRKENPKLKLFIKVGGKFENHRLSCSLTLNDSRTEPARISNPSERVNIGEKNLNCPIQQFGTFLKRRN